jgi:hypothetical protein
LTEALSFFYFAGFLQEFDPGAQTIWAKTSFRIGGHRNSRQFRAPASAFRLASHRGAALRAFGFHRAMMAQLRRGVQRCEFLIVADGKAAALRLRSGQASCRTPN